ncbi:hypothetical protein NIES4071_87510 [Calothrix sp. NIES-4071]|nr:hypothetical protein NIES4071_87510 [Calothrix sp. NIES-4071]BAZ63018.1 hypothetical protein NIES4105_87440 [Calothrix sp. NIES-4105]
MFSTKLKIILVTTSFTVLQSFGLLDSLNEQAPGSTFTLSSKAYANTFQGYVPPKERRPIERTDGAGSRGCPEGLFGSLNLLVPNDHVGLTISERPTFSWYVSAVPSTPMQFALVEPGVAKPLLVKTIKVDKPGLVQLQIPAHVKELTVGKQYRWTVSLVCNVKRPSLSIYARSRIMRVPSTEVSDFSKMASEQLLRDKAIFYAQRGIWYDAVSNITKAYLSNPDRFHATYLRGLLEQVGLSNVVAKELRRQSEG